MNILVAVHLVVIAKAQIKLNQTQVMNDMVNGFSTLCSGQGANPWRVGQCPCLATWQAVVCPFGEGGTRRGPGVDVPLQHF